VTPLERPSAPILQLGSKTLQCKKLSRASFTVDLCGIIQRCCGGSDLWVPRFVRDDDVALPEDRNELLFDVGAEVLAVDRPVEDADTSRRGVP
jgi:hypothetical protein